MLQVGCPNGGCSVMMALDTNMNSKNRRKETKTSSIRCNRKIQAAYTGSPTGVFCNWSHDNQHTNNQRSSDKQSFRRRCFPKMTRAILRANLESSSSCRPSPTAESDSCPSQTARAPQVVWKFDILVGLRLDKQEAENGANPREEGMELRLLFRATERERIISPLSRCCLASVGVLERRLKQQSCQRLFHEPRGGARCWCWTYH